jgi:hypothetical protein
MNCHRVHGAFDERQQRQFGRHAALFDLFDDVVQIAPATIEHALQVLRPVEIELFFLGHQRGVELRHGEARPDPAPEVALDQVLLRDLVERLRAGIRGGQRM